MVKRLGPMCGSFAISCRLLGKSKHKNKDGNNFNWQYLTGVPGGKGTTLWRIVLANLKMKKLGSKRVRDEARMTHLEDGEPGPNPSSLNCDHQKASICGLQPRMCKMGDVLASTDPLINIKVKNSSNRQDAKIFQKIRMSHNLPVPQTRSGSFWTALCTGLGDGGSFRPLVAGLEHAIRLATPSPQLFSTGSIWKMLFLLI